MFNSIPPAILKRMQQLEYTSQQEQQAGATHLQRLWQVPPATGRFLAFLAAGAPQGLILEIGTSGGYSTLWLSLAARRRGERVVTFEVSPEKISLAQETLRLAQVTDVVELIHGDARHHLSHYREIAFCFLDADKDVYLDCYRLIIPNLVMGGLLVADNATSHATELAAFLAEAESDPRIESLVVPVGQGVLVGRKVVK